MEGDVSRHLRRHWGQRQLIAGLLETTKWSNWQLKCTTGRLWNLQAIVSSRLSLIVGRWCAINWRHRWDKRRKHAWLGSHELRLELVEARGASSLTRWSRQAEQSLFRDDTGAHMTIVIACCHAYWQVSKNVSEASSNIIIWLKCQCVLWLSEQCEDLPWVLRIGWTGWWTWSRAKLSREQGLIWLSFFIVRFGDTCLLDWGILLLLM